MEMGWMSLHELNIQFNRQQHEIIFATDLFIY